MSSAPQSAGSSETTLTSSDDLRGGLPSSINREFLSLRERWWVAGLILIALVVRLITLGQPALVDPSESRFATSAQQMIEGNNFITPKIHTSQGWENYWAKPPLHMWLTAASFRLFGYTTEAARFPGFMSIALSAAMVAAIGAIVGSWSLSLLAALVYISCGGVFLFSAVSLTDPTLALLVSSAFFATFIALFGVTDPKKRDFWFRGAFVALGLGFLTKGPVAVVLFGVGAGLWLGFSGRWSRLREVPWRSGLALFFSIWIPWYIAAEIATPGFLRYFFIQENFLRFVSSDESGVRYGTLHTQPHGMIWLMFIGVAFPWSLIGIGRLVTGARWRSVFPIVRQNENVLFLVCWAVASPLFFTAARQVLPTYVFSALPAVAVLTAMGIASFIGDRESQRARSPGIARVAGLCGTCGFLGGLYGLYASGLNSSGSAIVCIIGLFVVLAANRFRQSRAAVIVPVGMIGLIALYSGIVAGGDAYWSTRRSARTILEAVHNDVVAYGGKEGAIAFLYGSPHSVIFYRSTVIPELPVVSMGSDLAQARAAGANQFILKESDLLRLSPADLEQLELRASSGKWRYYRSKLPPFSNINP
jgi:4-amino-4-deoxy-L-arabinose transferase-like glycosyltransferase